MRERELRQALLGQLLEAHHGEPNTLIRYELGLLHGEVRVDVAVINGALHGYELKSERDSLRRLPRQVEAYSAVLERCTLVVAASHLHHALPLLPAWWGVRVATSEPGGVALHHQRDALPNPGQQARALTELLWREEVLAALACVGADKGVRSKPIGFLRERLTQAQPLEALGAIVRRTILSRRNW